MPLNFVIAETKGEAHSAAQPYLCFYDRDHDLLSNLFGEPSKPLLDRIASYDTDAVYYTNDLAHLKQELASSEDSLPVIHLRRLVSEALRLQKNIYVYSDRLVG